MMEKTIYDDIDWVIRAVEEHRGDEVVADAAQELVTRLGGTAYVPDMTPGTAAVYLSMLIARASRSGAAQP
jgi:hypothetical protein